MFTKKKKLVIIILALVIAGLACGVPSNDTSSSEPNLEATLMQIT